MTDTTQPGPVEQSVSSDQSPLSQSGQAAVVSAQSDSSVSMPSTHQVPLTSTSLESNSVNLNALMEDLDRNMTQQGVSTVPKGHCSSCSKPIVGQVTCKLLCVLTYMSSINTMLSAFSALMQ